MKLKVTVFIAGASVMIVEILGSRIMAPYFGASTYVWSALIGIILGSLSAGYYVGGRWADKEPTKKKLSMILIIAAALVGLIPIVKGIILPTAYILFGILGGTLIAPMVLLSLPAFFMGMVSPYAIKLSAKNLEEIGSIAGDLFALSTMGSIIGTILTGFVLIPFFNLSAIFFSVSFLLVACSIILNYEGFKIEQHYLIFVLVILMLVHREPYYGDKKLLHLEYTPYNRILIAEDEHTRYMFLDGRATGAIEHATGFSAYDYTDYYEIPYLINQGIRDVLVVGEGTGAGPRQISVNHPDSKVVVAEIDPRVRDMAQEFFMVEEDDRLMVLVGDARMIVKDTSIGYDYVVLDAYNSINTIPYHLVTKEFFHDIKDVLNPGGVILMNLISPVEGSRSLVLQSVLKTVASEFDHIRIYPTRSSTYYMQNVLIIASNEPIPTNEELRSRAYETKVLTKSRIRSTIDDGLEETPSYEDGHLLTDEKNPIDHLYLMMFS